MKNNLFSCRQFGFISGRSTTLQLLKWVGDWTSMLARGENTNCIYTGFRKTFDNVPQWRLLAKAWHYGIRGRLYNWIKNFLSQHTQQVTVNGKKSRSSPVISGIPQGSVLGPLLIVIFINHLLKVVDSTMLMFADDTKLYGRADSPGEEKKLQEDLNAMVEWSKQWQLPFHPYKAKVIHVGKSREQCNWYSLGNEPEAPLTNIVTEKMNSEVTIDSTPKFKVHIAEKRKKANREHVTIRRTFRVLDDETLKLLFCALVRPHLKYASSVWCPHLVKLPTMVKNVQGRATRLLKNSASSKPIIRGQNEKAGSSKIVFQKTDRWYDRGFQNHASDSGIRLPSICITATVESIRINTKSLCETRNREILPNFPKVCFFAKDCQGLELPPRISCGR